MGDGHIFVIILATLGCGTGILCTFIDRAFRGKQGVLQQEVKLAQERARMLELQLLESHHHNEQLQKQLDWHSEMLETQDRLVKALTNSSSRTPVSSSS